MPEGVVNVVTGYGETAGAALAAHTNVDKVAFTGSTEVGKLIVQAAAGNLKKVTLELGGKSPNIVFDDADLEAAIAGAANGIFFNHGQCCVAGSRLYVQEDRFDEVVDGVAESAKSIKMGPGMDPDTQMGPLVSDEQLSASPATSSPAGPKARGRSPAAPGRATEATSSSRRCSTDTCPDMRVVREEIFGPVVVAAPFETIDDIADVANDTEYGLAAGIWTKDISKAHALAKQIQAGTVWINCYNIFDARSPSAATSSPAGAARWATRPSRPTPKSRR